MKRRPVQLAGTAAAVFLSLALVSVGMGCGASSEPPVAAGVDEQSLRSCGNGVCSGKETCSTCPTDCGPCRFCGDGACNGDETCAACAADCGTCPTFCGDGTCHRDETCDACAADCGACPSVCGDGSCSGGETCLTCAGDCGACPSTPACGDGTCNGDETCATCAGDCGACAPAAGRIAFVSDRSDARTLHIYLANPDGSGVTLLTEGGAPAWSADGSKIAFHRTDGIHVIDANGANERFLRAGSFPTWSPDGTKIAYTDGYGMVGFEPVGGIFVMNADGTDPRLLLGHEFAYYPSGWLGDDYCTCSPAWSPDGRTIAFVGHNIAGRRIYFMNADGSGSPSPLPGSDAQQWPAWSPDGSRIAYARGWNSEELASSTPSGSDVELHVSEVSGIHLGDPAWAPDGQTLVFSRSSPWEEGPVTHRIYTVREDGSVRRLIPEAESPAYRWYSDMDPAWSWAE